MKALYTQYFPEPCEQISQACSSGGIRTHDSCNSRAVSYQLDYGGCQVARGSSNPTFFFFFLFSLFFMIDYKRPAGIPGVFKTPSLCDNCVLGHGVCYVCWYFLITIHDGTYIYSWKSHPKCWENCVLLLKGHSFTITENQSHTLLIRCTRAWVWCLKAGYDFW